MNIIILIIRYFLYLLVFEVETNLATGVFKREKNIRLKKREKTSNIIRNAFIAYTIYEFRWKSCFNFKWFLRFWFLLYFLLRNESIFSLIIFFSGSLFFLKHFWCQIRFHCDRWWIEISGVIQNIFFAFYNAFQIRLSNRNNMVLKVMVYGTYTFLE